MKKITSFAAATLLVIVLFWLLCLNHVGVTTIGVSYNSLTGEIMVQKHPGWYVTSPFVRVCTISTLPMRVQIPSSARIINQRLVRFNPDGAVQFVKTQGFEWLQPGELENILLGYAYSGDKYEFLEIIEEPGTAGR